MNVSASGLTREDVERFLVQKGASDGERDELRSILAACDSARYSPVVSAGQGGENALDVVERAATLVKQLDRGRAP
jgi:hypothetical protein